MPTGYPRLAAFTALGLLGAIYVFRGLEALIIHGSDLKLYWDQFHSALAGHNPYDLGNAYTAYTPFFLETLPFYWPAWPFAKYYFTGITLASLAYVMNWAYRASNGKTGRDAVRL